MTDASVTNVHSLSQRRQMHDEAAANIRRAALMAAVSEHYRNASLPHLDCDYDELPDRLAALGVFNRSWWADLAELAEVTAPTDEDIDAVVAAFQRVVDDGAVADPFAGLS